MPACPTCGDDFAPTRGRKYCGKGCWPSRRPYRPDVAPEPTGDRTEVLALLWAAARKGSVNAMLTLAREI